MLEIKWKLINVYRPNSAEVFKMKCVEKNCIAFWKQGTEIKEPP